MTRKKPISSKQAGEAMQESALKLLGLSADVRKRKVTRAQAAQVVKQTFNELAEKLPSESCPS